MKFEEWLAHVPHNPGLMQILYSIYLQDQYGIANKRKISVKVIFEDLGMIGITDAEIDALDNYLKGVDRLPLSEL